MDLASLAAVAKVNAGGTANIFARLTTLTGKIVQTFEDTVQVDVPPELLPRTAENSEVYYKAVPLRPGRYKLNVRLHGYDDERGQAGHAGRSGRGWRRDGRAGCGVGR